MDDWKDPLRIIPLVKNTNISGLKTAREFLEYPDEWREHLKWLRKLPLFLEMDGIRVVHACWSEAAVEYVKKNLPGEKIKREVFRKISKNPGSELARHFWVLTKGLQFKIPGDLKIINNKGVSPRSFRMRWWEEPHGKTFEELSFESKFHLPHYTIPPQITPACLPYPENAPIIFFGHYCRYEGPHIIKPNICCIDSCITGNKSLLAYRWEGEKQLLPEKLIKVKK